MTWISCLKLKLLAYLVAIGLAAVAMTSLIGVSWLPALGVAVAAAAVTVNKAAGRLAKPACYTCGSNLADQPRSEYGIICPNCGSIRQPGMLELRDPKALAGRKTRSPDTRPPSGDADAETEQAPDDLLSA